jgi:hypothetical protein
MTLPSVLIGFVVSSIIAAVFHIWKNGGLGRLFLYLCIAWFGFWIGQFIGEYLEWGFLTLGPLNLGTASFICIVFLFVGDWLSRVEIQRE